MDYVWCFLCGGLLCLIGQVLIDLTKLTPARILTGYVVAGVILQAVGPPRRAASPRRWCSAF